jgi:hypothetical protein
MTSAKVGLTVRVQFVLIGISQNIKRNRKLSFEHMNAVKVKLSTGSNIGK